MEEGREEKKSRLVYGFMGLTRMSLSFYMLVVEASVSSVSA